MSYIGTHSRSLGKGHELLICSAALLRKHIHIRETSVVLVSNEADAKGCFQSRLIKARKHLLSNQLSSLKLTEIESKPALTLLASVTASCETARYFLLPLSPVYEDL